MPVAATRSWTLSLPLLAALLIALAADGPVALAQLPGPSPVIEAIRWDAPATIVRRAHGGDNWPLTWADDDQIYTTYGDGYGFKPKVRQKLSLGFARVAGGPGDFSGINIRSDDEQYGPGRAGRKGWGILCVDRVLYLWLGHADLAGGQSQLAWSTDHAHSWSFADWKWAEFGLVGFINFGRNYEGARDEFVYAYSHDGRLADTPADGFVLMRCPRTRIRDRGAWQFFRHCVDRGDPVWTDDVADRGQVMRRPGAALRSAITYNAGIERYLWWQQIPRPVGEPDRGDTRFEGGFAILDAPEPWGPWTLAYRTDAWDVGPGEHGDFPSKWISPDGRTLHLVFSGEDAFCVRRATLSLRGDLQQDAP